MCVCVYIYIYIHISMCIIREVNDSNSWGLLSAAGASEKELQYSIS